MQYEQHHHDYHHHDYHCADHPSPPPPAGFPRGMVTERPESRRTPARRRMVGVFYSPSSSSKRLQYSTRRCPRWGHLHKLSGVGLSAIRASPTRNGVNYLDLFAVVTDDQMTDEDSAVEADVGALKAGVMRLYGVVVILRWVRGCARLCGGHEDCSFVVRSRGGRRPSPGSMVSC